MLGNILLRILRITPQLLLILPTLITSPGICLAVSMGTDPIPPEFTSTGFGSNEVYRAQTFRLPSGSEAVFAKNLTVFVGPTTDSGADFHVLLTEVDMASGFHPTNVIFESETLNVPVLPLRQSPDEFVVDLGRRLLQPDRDYAWILDYFVVRDQGAHVDMNTGLGSYSDGMAYSFPNGAYFPTGTREDHFSGNNWFEQEDHDFAFQLEFTSVSAPSVSSTSPADGATRRPADTIITATFSEEMDASTISDATFLVDDGSTDVAGTVTYDDTTATFTPATNLAYGKIYNVTITTDVQDLAGNPLENDHQWWFATETEPGGLGLTLDHYPLDKGSEWVYSLSPSTVSFNFEGLTFSVNLTDCEISIPVDGHRRLEIAFSGTVNGYSFSGNIWYEEEYIVDSGQIRLAAEQGSFTVRIPGEGSSTVSLTGTLIPPLSLLEAGMEVGESISYGGTERMETTTDGGAPEVTEESINGTTRIVGKQEVPFGDDLVDAIEVQMDSMVDGEPSSSTFHLARFIGPVRMEDTALQEFFEGVEQVTYTLKSTNLPLWDSIRTYAVDSSAGDVLDFDLNGGTATMIIPAGCLSGPTTVTVGDISNIPDSSGVNGMTWAVGINIDEPGISLTCPITVTIPYTQSDLDDARVSDPKDLKVYRWGSPSSGWQALDVAAVDTVNQTISLEVSQLSVFGLGAHSSSGGGGGCLIGTVADSIGW
jgi:hypothetical protein